MPRRYTTKLQLQKLNETVIARKRQQQNAQNENAESSEDASSDGEENRSLEESRKADPTRRIMEMSRHDTHPALNEGLGNNQVLNMFPNAAFTVPLPLYVADRTTPIVDPCLQRPYVHDDWMRQLSVYKTKYLSQTQKQKQRERKHQANIYNTYLFEVAEHIATQENTHFRDSYDYYYTGGNLNIMSYAAAGDEPKTLALHVTGEKLQQLHVSQLGEEAELLQSLHSEKMPATSSELFELMPVKSFRVNHGNMFLARQLNDIAIYELRKLPDVDDDNDDDSDDDEDSPSYEFNCQCKYNSEDGPFIGVAQGINRPNVLAIACQDRTIRFLDMESQQDISRHTVSIFKGASTWAQLRAWKENCFVYACQSAVINVDMRCANKEINPLFASSVYSKRCETFSCLAGSVNPHLLYVASNHKLHAIDMRCLGKKIADRAVVTWTHQMCYPPTFMDTIAQDGSEYVAMSNAVPGDQRICELNNALAQNVTEMSSQTFAYAPPQLEEALIDAQLKGCSISIYADLGQRLRSATTGVKFHRLEKASDGAFAQLLTANSVGDVFCQRVTQRDELEMQQEQRTGSHTNEAILYYADLVKEHVSRKLRCTDVQSMVALRDIMKSERDVEEDKPMPFEDIEIDYGFEEVSTEAESGDDDSNNDEEKQPKAKKPTTPSQPAPPPPPPEEPKVPKKKAVNRGPWQKSAHYLSQFEDVISTRLLSIWDIDEFDLTRDVNIDMIDEKLKRHKDETQEVEDPTASWLQTAPKPEELSEFFDEQKTVLVPGTNLRTHYDAVYADYVEVSNETTDIEALLATTKPDENASFNETVNFNKRPHSTLRPGEFTIVESQPNPRPKRQKTKYTMGF
ncbi:uncharacterized protein LOC133845940 [Drosophila sulfurigaster albostrigata]|uniref:uncharacterized protein LOC133845940 n=1 Tax=Drosophila sulfurigaster albostrigata TaxID=89887 RepID=UPI002D21A9E9|nr:uncharacterized protein LOC133845940 [Drosophila sulfurigaster albostrigata]XP_062136589.1 uncharacterized protein LOC133845940 [Drosophila sulfurigaster albostrigata]XP_062136590.1 uncharacterized protein LOC133845940 [Drosophila sulfurigaster albostrigata]